MEAVNDNLTSKNPRSNTAKVSVSMQDYEVFRVRSGILRSRYSLNWMVDLLVSRRQGDFEGVDDESVDILQTGKIGKFSRCARLRAHLQFQPTTRQKPPHLHPFNISTTSIMRIRLLGFYCIRLALLWGFLGRRRVKRSGMVSFLSLHLIGFEHFIPLDEVYALSVELRLDSFSSSYSRPRDFPMSSRRHGGIHLIPLLGLSDSSSCVLRPSVTSPSPRRHDHHG
jgi:hypothetical protein